MRDTPWNVASRPTPIHWSKRNDPPAPKRFDEVADEWRQSGARENGPCCLPHAHPCDTRISLCVESVSGGRAFSLISSPLSADSCPSLFEWLIGTTPLSDSSGMCMRAVRPEPSPAVLWLLFAAGIPEVSRFSCMKFLGVSGVFDYAGLSRNSHNCSCSCGLPRITKTVGVRIASFRSSIAHPAYTPVYTSLTPSRESAQDSGPSGSLVLVS
jgi:hypothetical protein